MRMRHLKRFRAIAILLVFAVAQVYIQLGIAAPNASTSTVILPQQLVATITSTGGAPLINGTAASSNSTVLSGMTIETPPGVRASINLGALGRVDMEPNTKIEIYFECDETAPVDANQKKCRVRVALISGCVNVAAGKDTRGQVDLPGQPDAVNTDQPGRRDSAGSPLPFTQCAGIVPTGIVAAGGLSTGAKIAILSAAISVPFALWYAFHGGGEDPSP